jgi:site-specific DNA recombinase
VYYFCPHNPANARHVAAAPDHPSHIPVREDALLAAISQFFTERIFGPERAALLAAQIPADADADADAAQRDKKTAALRKRLRQIDAAENAHAREIKSSPAWTTRMPPPSPQPPSPLSWPTVLPTPASPP